MKRFLLILGLFPALTFAAPNIRPIPVRIPARPVPAKPAPARPAKPVHSDDSAVVPIAAVVATQNHRTQNRDSGTTCLAVKVSDGDTFTCAKGYGDTFQVRLADIDAPESGQAYGNQARKALNKLIYKQMVTLKNTKKDKYGRSVATVYLGSGTNVNLAMIEQGYAWHYERYSNNAEYAAAMRQAQAKKRGLWADKGKIIKPENWRHK